MTDSNEGGDPKDNADVPPVLPNEQPTASEAGGVLSPEDLDFTDSPHVAEVSDGRYVVSADHSPAAVSESPDRTTPDRSPPQSNSQPSPDLEPDHSPEPASEPTASGETASGRQPVRSPEAARSLLASELERTNAPYAIDIVSRFTDTTVRHRTTSDDVVGTFDNLVLWYAQNVANDTSTQRTATLLFDKSEFTAPLSPSEVRREAKKHGLSRSSSIGDLLDALE